MTHLQSITINPVGAHFTGGISEAPESSGDPHFWKVELGAEFLALQLEEWKSGSRCSNATNRTDAELVQVARNVLTNPFQRYLLAEHNQHPCDNGVTENNDSRRRGTALASSQYVSNGTSIAVAGLGQGVSLGLSR
ncbi:MAG: hypothetical protein HYV63_25070 [Candidatus Schekmanbacteria bacterium]|nr:hypothetical protein [Candidatus Schekmanbacteria bacterium]